MTNELTDELTDDDLRAIVENIQSLEARDVLRAVTAIERETFTCFDLGEAGGLGRLLRRNAEIRDVPASREYLAKGRAIVLACAKRAERRNDVSFLVPGLYSFIFKIKQRPIYVCRRSLDKALLIRLERYYNDTEVDDTTRRWTYFTTVHAVDFRSFKETRTFERTRELTHVDDLCQVVDVFLTGGTLDDDTFQYRVEETQRAIFKRLKTAGRNATAFTIKDAPRGVLFILEKIF